MWCSAARLCAVNATPELMVNGSLEMQIDGTCYPSNEGAAVWSSLLTASCISARAIRILRAWIRTASRLLQEWWLRPMSGAARVGEHKAIVWEHRY
jgi:hypothetical protein